MARRRKSTRREFLKTAGAAIAVPYVITSNALGNADVPPASDRIVMGGIGIGNMGRGDQGAFLGRSDVQYVAVCDVREGFREAGKAKVDEHYKNKDCQATTTSASCWLGPTSTPCISPRPTTGTPSWSSRPAATARTSTARSPRRSRCAKAR